MFDVFETQKRLVAAACPSGSEHLKIGPLLAELARPFVDEIRTDALNNVICLKKGTGDGKKIMMAGHMDAIGFMVTFIDDKGFILFDPIGGHPPALLINTRVRFLNGQMGIIRAKKFAKAMEKGSGELRHTDLYIDIGAKDKAEAESVLKLGDVALFEGESVMAAGGNIMGPYADDLAACMVLLLTMEQAGESKNDVYYVFTAQEEVGCRGAVVAAYGIEPDIGFACDVCSTGDTPQDTEIPMAVSLGKGPAIKIKDSSVICSPQLNEKLRKIANDNGIAYQDEILRAGGTDTCAMQKTHAGVAATCVSIPTRNIHSAVEMFNAQDAADAAKLLALAARAEY